MDGCGGSQHAASAATAKDGDDAAMARNVQRMTVRSKIASPAKKLADQNYRVKHQLSVDFACKFEVADEDLIRPLARFLA